MKEQVYRISPDGKTVQTITNGDDVPFGEIEALVRASHVRFDNVDKKWYVWFRSVDRFNMIVERRSTKGFSTRKEAIEFEVHNGNNLLTDMPDEVERLMQKHLDHSHISG